MSQAIRCDFACRIWPLRVIEVANEKNILLVEDEEALRMTVQDRLRKDGYMVECTGDGLTGFRKATSLPFDLMILDVMLPCRNGVDLCRDLRIAGLRTPVLMLSALRETEDVIAGFHAGADDYVTKPFEMQELTARVETLLRGVPAAKHQRADSPPKISAQHSRVSRSATSGSQACTKPKFHLIARRVG
jgi:two-component system, OmpR family, response regulator MprA